jgi:hypothetical protein
VKNVLERRRLEAFAIKDATAEVSAKLLVEEVICRHGTPKKLLSDRGKTFLAKLSYEVYNLLNIKKINTSAYHPQTDGLVERFNHTLATMLAIFAKDNQKDWDVYLPYVLFAYRTSQHDGLKETPFYLVYGRDAKLPIEFATQSANYEEPLEPGQYAQELQNKLKKAYDLVCYNGDLNKQKQIERYNDRRESVEYEIGMKIWLYVPQKKKGLAKKLLKPWKGPFKVIAKKSPVTYEIQDLVNKKLRQIVHVDRMKPYVKPDIMPEEEPRLPEEDSDEEPELESQTKEDADLKEEGRPQVKEDIKETPTPARRETEKKIEPTEIINEEDKKPNRTSKDAKEETKTDHKLAKVKNAKRSEFESLKSILNDILKSLKKHPLANVNKMKRDLTGLLCSGSAFIIDGHRHEKFAKEIKKIQNYEELVVFIENLIAKFDDTFAYEMNTKISKY